MQKWEYLQLHESMTRGAEERAWVDNTGRTWRGGRSEVNVSPEFARDFFSQKKPPYLLWFCVPPPILDDLGSEGWQLVYYAEGNLMFQRPTE